LDEYRTVGDKGETFYVTTTMRAYNVQQIEARRVGPPRSGVAGGMILSLTLTDALRSVLFGVSPTDTVTFAAAAGFLGAVGLLASYIPARRATRLSPVVALRSE
jgi:ABC-type lipoprotein release transport system permease subunit